MEHYSINSSVKKSNIPNDLAEIVNFHFSHYKSMGTISFHSNQSSYPTGIKNTTYVEAKVLSMYAFGSGELKTENPLQCKRLLHFSNKNNNTTVDIRMSI